MYERKKERKGRDSVDGATAREQKRSKGKYEGGGGGNSNSSGVYYYE